MLATQIPLRPQAKKEDKLKIDPLKKRDYFCFTLMGNTFLSAVSGVGTKQATDKSEINDIVITNRISILLSALPLLYIALNVYNQGWSRITLPILTQPFFFLIPILFNYLGYTTMSRVLISWSMPVLAMLFSIYNKRLGLDLETSHYLGIRFSILASSVIPFLVFRLKNSLLIGLSLLPTFLSLIAFDLIHDLFQVGYYKIGLQDSGYSLTTMRVMIAFLLITGGALVLKISVEKNEALNLELISELTELNNEIQTQLEEITAQNDQILLQKEKLEEQYVEIRIKRDDLHQHQEKLSDALQTINTQHEVLLNENKNLEFEVLQKNKELSQNNQQLIRYNNDLQQFSFTVSHNLRGPVATILGLISLINKETIDPVNFDMFINLEKTIRRLDEIIRDLNRILDIQNEVFHVRRPIFFPHVVREIKESFRKDIEQFGISFIEDYEGAVDLFSIPPLVNSIVYNLVSNAIKYRSPERRPEIRITSKIQDDFYTIKVLDNGIGIDVKMHRAKLFQLYKRFNTHTEGKGIGLYLIKLQAEILGGHVEVVSEINQFTEFTIYLPVLSGLDKLGVIADRNYPTAS